MEGVSMSTADSRNATTLDQETPTKSRPALFRALGIQEPPPQVVIAGIAYQRVRVFKHDSWAATALYEGNGEQIICKFQRQQSICKVPMKWFGRLLASHERSLYHRLAGLTNLPRLLGDVYVEGKRCPHVVAHHFVPGHPLGMEEQVSDAFFPELEAFLIEMHKRATAYVDLHKRENIIVGEDGRPYLIDFQISLALPRWWPANSFLSRWFLRLLQGSDRYHFRKHFARCRPDQCGYSLHDVGRKRPWWIRLHRLAAVPFRTLRRKLLVLLGVRSGVGHAHSEQFTEEGLRVEGETRKTAA
jgi:hypothetical protein